MSSVLEQSTKPRIRSVQRMVRGQPASDGAGVKLTRVIGTNALPDLDPFLMLDEFGSDDPAAYIAGFPDHPHRGFETVTYMLAGRMRHGDNKGNTGLLGPGSVQWMTAGRGIVHSEMPEQEEGLMQGFQLWINLPAKDKMIAPRYQDIPADAVPVVEQGGASVKVLAGRYGSARGPVDPGFTDPLYLDVALEAGAQFTAPIKPGHSAFLYVHKGSIEVAAEFGGQRVMRGSLAVLADGDQLQVRSAEGGKFLVLAGRPLREPIAKYGPFVMNTADEIRQAVMDYQAGRF